MKLYFNGCSFTHGDELENPEKDSWPAVVASWLNSDFFNDAVSGGTNDRTIYKTMLNGHRYDYYFIAWTTYTRFTEYNPVDNFEINFTTQLNLDPSLHHSDDLKKNYSKYKKYGELYYKNWFNELYEFKKWLQQIILLQSFFDKIKKPYTMLNTMPNHLSLWLSSQESFISSCRNLISFFDCVNDDQLLEEHKQIQELNSLIDKSKFISWNDWSIVDTCKLHPCGPGGHILESGHFEVAKKILEHYNKTK
jgi:hypothetical protein